MRGVGVNAVARLAVLPVSAVLGLVVTRIVLTQYGEAAYAHYMLLVGIAALIPFADLGISAAVMNAVAQADDPSTDPETRAVLVSAIRILTCSAAVVVALALVVASLGAWEALLGEGLLSDGGSTGATLTVVVIGVTLVFSFGHRILTGLGRYHVVILLGGLQTPIVLLVLLVIVSTDVGGFGAYLPVLAFLANLVVALITLAVANKAVRPAVRLAVSSAWRLRTVRGARVMATAVPMFISTVALPIAMQTDRLVLSHVADLGALTEYSLAAQMYTPLVGVIAAAGLALWPVFAKARADGVRSDVSPRAMALLFGAVAALFVVAISLASGVLSELASDGAITLGLPVLLSFSVLIVLQAVKYPFGMYMTDARGLRYQAAMIVTMVPVNLGLSIVLAREIGAAGPVIGSAAGVLLFQVVANWVYVQRDLRRTAPTSALTAG